MIRIVFTTSNRLHSRLIRFFTGSEISHVGVVFHDDTLGMNLVMHATPRGFVVETWKHVLQKRKPVYVYSCNRPLDDALRTLATQLGARYDYAGVLGGAVQYIFNLLGRRIKNPFASARKLWCSEAVVRLMQSAGVMGSARLVPESTSPERLRAFFRASDELTLSPCSCGEAYDEHLG